MRSTRSGVSVAPAVGESGFRGAVEFGRPPRGAAAT